MFKFVHLNFVFFATANGQDGTGNDDIVVTHTPPTWSYRLDISYWSTEDDVKKSAREELRKATGASTSEIKQIGGTTRTGRKGNQYHMICEVKLFKAGCCGKTGKGGPGKIIIYFLFIYENTF